MVMYCFCFKLKSTFVAYFLVVYYFCFKFKLASVTYLRMIYFFCFNIKSASTLYPFLCSLEIVPSFIFVPCLLFQSSLQKNALLSFHIPCEDFASGDHGECLLAGNTVCVASLVICVTLFSTCFPVSGLSDCTTGDSKPSYRHLTRLNETGMKSYCSPSIGPVVSVSRKLYKL